MRTCVQAKFCCCNRVVDACRCDTRRRGGGAQVRDRGARMVYGRVCQLRLGLRQELARHKRKQQQRNAPAHAWHHAAATFCPPPTSPLFRRGDSASDFIINTKRVRGSQPTNREIALFLRCFFGTSVASLHDNTNEHHVRPRVVAGVAQFQSYPFCFGPAMLPTPQEARAK